MRIAHLAPLYERVPPRTYGGTELVVHLLVEAQVRAGHDVSLFASGDSITSARLVSVVPRPRRAGTESPGEQTRHLLNALACYREAHRFDVIHNHAVPEGLALAQLSATPVVTTNHLVMTDALRPLYADLPWYHVSASWASAKGFPRHNSAGVVYHGIDLDSYPFTDRHGGYLLFLGRMGVEKGPDRAIEVARRTGRRLLLAGKIGEVDRPYWTRDVEPKIDGSRISYVGEVGPDDKRRLLMGAEALLFPIAWPEPFGLVMVEAMACGTPVLALGAGSVSEIVAHGETGFVVDTVDQLVEVVRMVPMLSREAARRRAEARFSARRMADEYEALYRSMIGRRLTQRLVVGRAGALPVDDQPPGGTKLASGASAAGSERGGEIGRNGGSEREHERPRSGT
jgi:glycosyltransferase involved in cell wall biosynthesis